MRKNRKLDLKNHSPKINVIFLILLISNIILYLGMIWFYGNTIYEEVDLDTINKIFTIVSTIIILGFISTRLPQFRKIGDSSIYEIGYLIIIGIFSMMLSFFNESTNSKSFLGPYLSMFEILSVILIMMIIATKLKPFKELMQGKATRKNQIICLVIFTILACIASHVHIYIGGTPANVRCLIIMIGGLFGGPIVGIPSALIAGVYRYSLGGLTAFPCSISTVICGILGSVVYIWNGKKFLKNVPAVVMMFLFTGFEMLMIVLLTPPQISYPYITHIYPLMVFGSVLGMILFLMVIRESKKGTPEHSYEEFRINELENRLDEYENKIDQLEETIYELKGDNKEDDEF